MEEGLHYELLDTVGTGGFGTVYRAIYRGESGFSKTVAMKVLHAPEAAEAHADRLRDEAQWLGLMRHRAIVHVDRLIRVGGRWTLVMEFVDGVDLRAAIAHGAVPPGPAVGIVGEIAGALHHAWHAKGTDGQPLHLLHRDIKPSNVHITAAGDVKVLDFGIAKAIGSAPRGVNTSVIGSLPYLSPERLAGLDGPEGDVYSLGVLLIELITGEIVGPTRPERTAHEAKIGPVLRVLADRLGVETGLVALIGDLLAFEASARPTARDLERRCGKLGSKLGDESFRDWAERQVPLIMRRSSEKQGDKPAGALTGSLVAQRPAPDDDDTHWFDPLLLQASEISPELRQRVRSQSPAPLPSRTPRPAPAAASSVLPEPRREPRDQAAQKPTNESPDDEKAEVWHTGSLEFSISEKKLLARKRPWWTWALVGGVGGLAAIAVVVFLLWISAWA